MSNNSLIPMPPPEERPFVPAHLRLPPRLVLFALAGVLALAIPLGVLAGSLHARDAAPVATIPANSDAHVTITFTRATQTVSAPNSTLVAATSGGQIAAQSITVTVKRATSDPIQAQAQGGQYVVPANCGDPSPAYHAASQGLQAKLSSATPGDTIAFYGPYFGFSNFTCEPAPGTTQATPFDYFEQVDGFAGQTVYHLSDAQLYQIAQMQATVPAHMELISTTTCSGTPPLANRTSSSVTITCPTSGMAAWAWSSADLQQLAARLVGLSPADAQSILNHTPGIVPGSTRIAAQGAASLPQQVAQFAFVVNG